MLIFLFMSKNPCEYVGHFQQETGGPYYLEEIHKSAYCSTSYSWIVDNYPCIPGKMYFGRGAKQLSWNYNYGAFSSAMFGDPMVLLENLSWLQQLGSILLLQCGSL